MKTMRSTKSTTSSRRLLALAFALAVIAAACNDSTTAGDKPSDTSGQESTGTVITVSGSNDSEGAATESDSPAPETSADTEAGGESDGTTGANEPQYLVSILIGTYSVSAEPTGCNSDEVLGNVVVDLYLLSGGEISGEVVDSGSSVQMLSRCPGTFFGGVSDVGDELLTVSGQLSSDGIQLTLAAADAFEFYLTDGTTLGITSIMGSFLENAGATSEGVSGTAMDFTIDSDTMAALSDTDTSANFAGADSPDDGAWWDTEVDIFFYSAKLK